MEVAYLMLSVAAMALALSLTRRDEKRFRSDLVEVRQRLTQSQALPRARR
ncbi:MAG: hypothetical protein KQJ78_03530 [Deltaproteobacteria bacterium]|nr:hypothetical protein [Deltaproteobacteria bacterium]